LDEKKNKKIKKEKLFFFRFENLEQERDRRIAFACEREREKK
jgi:hypothetical protein